jgi:Cu(I)/Ag(I) efflux system membrane fusion protein
MVRTIAIALVALLAGAAGGAYFFRHARATEGDMAGMTMPPAEGGMTGVMISPARQQRTAIVGEQDLDTSLRAVGSLTYDETRVTEIHTRVTGWVEQLYVSFVGQQVKRGQALFSFYSPELVSTENEYLLALESAETPVRETLLTSARERLRRWSISDAQLAELERTRKVARTITFYSPFDGVVIERNTFAGQMLQPEMAAFKIGDLSTIWAVGEVFESDMESVKVGQAVTVTFPHGRAADRLEGKIDFVFPEIDAQTRRVKVRASFPNPDLRWKPQTYVQITLHGAPTRRLAVPKDAVIDTGDRRYVLVALEGGHFDPRDVELDSAIGDFYPVVKGVAASDRVVVSAQFLVDSESNLAAAMKAMSATMPGMDMK